MLKNLYKLLVSIKLVKIKQKLKEILFIIHPKNNVNILIYNNNKEYLEELVYLERKKEVALVLIIFWSIYKINIIADEFISL